jgi:hypothetical protein
MHSSLTRALRPARAVRGLACLIPVLLAASACDGNPYDTSQIPRITITPEAALPLVIFAWTPAGAQSVRVFKGTIADGSAANLMWSISSTNGNTLVSGIEYGTSKPTGGVQDLPAKPLIPGQAYTVQIGRVDPKAKLYEVTGARYLNTQTFTISSIVVPP